MPYTPTPNDALLETAIAANALTQLNLNCVYPKMGVVDYEPGAFERGEQVKIRRPKRRRAQDLDPRVAAATYVEASFFKGQVILERLWTDGFPIYGHDPGQTTEKYITESATQISDAICTPNEEYLYSVFRTWNLPATGAVALGDNAPVAICASLDSNGNFSAFGNTLLRNANLIMDRNNVPPSDRFAGISAQAKSDFLGDSTVVTGFVATTIGGGQLVQNGLPMGSFVERYGFQITGSNVVGGQTGLTDAPIAVASAAANTQFTIADEATTKYVGAVDFTLGAAPANYAVGQIARIDGGTIANTLAFGVILRISGSVVTLVPYSPAGALMVAAQFSSSDRISIPYIPSVNTFNHKEALLVANRMLRQPSERSGATAVSMADPDTNMTMQIFSGNYDITRVRELQAAYMLTGAHFSDFRKGGLMLSL